MGGGMEYGRGGGILGYCGIGRDTWCDGECGFITGYLAGDGVRVWTEGMDEAEYWTNFGFHDASEKEAVGISDTYSSIRKNFNMWISYLD